LGYDFGTSGVRCAIVDASGEIVANPPGYSWGVAGERAQEASDWEEALFSQLAALPADARARVSRIAVSGTSGSMLLVDGDGAPAASRGSPRISGGRLLRLGLRMVGDCHIGHPVRSATSALAKLLAYHFESPLAGSERLAHQADYVASRLTGGAIASDWHNALKLGFDVRALRYPEWLTGGEIGEIARGRLPRVVRPGEPIGPVSDKLVAKYGLASGCLVVGGTTDSIAAFLAAGADSVGDAVTSLGSTLLVVQLLSDVPADDASTGVYSHRLGDRWLVGGASNAGCAVLREQGFSGDELARLSEEIDPLAQPPCTDYYPLSSLVRFPRPDENAVGVLEPVPESRAAFLHCILHGIAKAGGRRGCRSSICASELRRVLTSGGGSQNAQWTVMRQALLGVPTSRAANIDAAYGAALLA
ncbi:hypothetical protein EMIHUDRAFT_42376, partial [Emiliania huxleyi CCMP1516]|uniref:Carbohydrate kinase FGGY C-terminal domain-containing protein n=2 Tax=Emiliania huxleyi TaxID=2903 RepID=A0A0D3I5T2_EMIH1